MVLLYDQNVPKRDLEIAAYSSLKNQLLYTFPTCVIFTNYYPLIYDNFLLSIPYVPLLIISSDVYFYLTHLPLHSKYLYHLHKHHHNGKICVAKSLDANFIEHIFGNLGSFLVGILALWYFNIIINIYVISGWIGMATISTCISHSNSNCFMDNGLHNNHHKYRNCNYGFGIYLMDRIMNTYKK